MIFQGSERADTIQDERDHAFGRLFGVSAIVESRILMGTSSYRADVKALVDIICDLALQKPWLREACGSVLLKFLISTGTDYQGYAEMLLDALAVRKLIRTPEAVAIWLQTEQQYPDAKLPNKVWKNDDPLQNANKVLLAEVLRDITPRTEKDNAEFGSQGQSVWNPQLHFAWDHILRELDFHQTSSRLRSSKAKEHRMSFPTFWAETVERMFHPFSRFWHWLT